MTESAADLEGVNVLNHYQLMVTQIAEFNGLAGDDAFYAQTQLAQAAELLANKQWASAELLLRKVLRQFESHVAHLDEVQADSERSGKISNQ